MVPLISVVMPTYNSERYIEESINSILSQTLSDFELIVVDDNSTDHTLEVLLSYTDQRIKIVDGPCKGISAALNIGLDIANGKYIARMDSDDISMPDRFQKQVNFLNSHPEIGLCGTFAEAFSPNGWSALWGNSNNRIEHLGLFDNLVDTVVCHPTVMFRRELFQKYGLRYNESFDSAEDQELWARAMRSICFYNMPEVLLRYRVHEKNASTFRMENGRRNLEKLRIELLEWLYPSGNYSVNELQQKIAIIKTVLQAEHLDNENVNNTDYFDSLRFENFPKWKKIIGLLLFNPSVFKEKLCRKFGVR